ncbi:MAG: SsrA-binding protein SmpB [Mariprofundaceae bacterium]|nr:SsrA-binding protein SmpB [Mariprofundaceae bacterium]
MAIINRRARHEYHFIENFDVGIMLAGPEVKSLRNGQANLAEAHCLIRQERVWLINCHINPYKPAARNNPAEPARARELLMHKREITRLLGKLKEKGLALVPLKFYFNDRGYAKLAIALARGKKDYDKRHAIRERDVSRDLQRRYKMR